MFLVLTGIRKFGEIIRTLKNKNTVKVMKIDEMHSYIASKRKAFWIWITVDRHRKKSSILTSANKMKNWKKSYGTKSTIEDTEMIATDY